MGAYTFKMPDIGEGIVEAEVVAWHVGVGDIVAEDAPVADVMTDKATVEITSPVAGTVRSLGCVAGEKMVIGATFVEFEVSEVSGTGPENTAAMPDDSAGEAPEQAPAPTAPTATTVTSKDVSGDDKAETRTDTPVETATKPKIRVVSDGDAAATAATMETSPAPETSSTPTAPSSQPAAAESPQPAMDKTAEVSAQDDQNTKNGRTEKSKVVDISPRREIVGASPAVRRLARDLGIDLASVKGSGPAGRVTNDDIRALLKSPQPAPASTNAGSPAAVVNEGVTAEKSVTAESQSENNRSADKATSTQRFNGVTELPVIGMRRLIAERMQTAKQRIPHFSYVEEVCVDQLEELRQHMNANREEHQPKLSILHFILLAVAREVVNWPQCNAHFDDENSSLQQHSRVHLGVATMTDNGLMVPVVANACQLDIWEIATEVNRLAEAARNGSLAREELTGSTITVTSLGPLAGITTTPVINRPETSIIGPNKIMQKVVWESGSAVPVSVMNISSSFDHRVVDGYDAACFIQAVRALLEKPALIFI